MRGSEQYPSNKVIDRDAIRSLQDRASSSKWANNRNEKGQTTSGLYIVPFDIPPNRAGQRASDGKLVTPILSWIVMICAIHCDTHPGDALPIKDERFKRDTYIESI